MLTIDDCNTILEKWGKNGFWYKFDFNKLNPVIGKQYTYDFIDIHSVSTRDNRMLVTFSINNDFWRYYYFTNSQGEEIDVNKTTSSEGYDQILFSGLTPDDVIMNLYINPALDIDYQRHIGNWIVPVSSLSVCVVNGEYNEKFYFTDMTDEYTDVCLNGTPVTVEDDGDGKGTYIILPEATDSVLGIGVWEMEYIVIPIYLIQFINFKTIPTFSIPLLYKGTPQEVKLYNENTEEHITEFQAYYQGKKLKDNIITLDNDVDDYINIIVDLKDYRYPFCTVKLKAPTTIYTANSQSDVESAIENGIETLQVGDNETEVLLNGIELTNVTLINSNIQINNSTITDCQIINSTYTDNGGNTVTSTIFKDTDYTNTAQSNYTEITFNECEIHDSEINLTGTITDSTITDTLIISDGVINIQDNTFTGVGSKEYFPSHLYLTGDYTVINNTFALEGEWEELQFNMCIIKATNDFNPSQFIKNNTFQLNITYEDEPTNTFYYNIVDDDKIRAVRL